MTHTVTAYVRPGQFSVIARLTTDYRNKQLNEREEGHGFVVVPIRQDISEEQARALKKSVEAAFSEWGLNRVYRRPL